VTGTTRRGISRLAYREDSYLSEHEHPQRFLMLRIGPDHAFASKSQRNFCNPLGAHAADVAQIKTLLDQSLE
jgi:hypothetical protein